MSRPQSAYNGVPAPSESQLSQGYGTSNHLDSSAADFAHANPTATDSSPIAQSMSTAPTTNKAAEGTYTDESSVVDHGAVGVDRAGSTPTTAVQATSAPSRSNTLKKRGSVKRTTSLKRSASKKSLQAGSVAGNGGVDSSPEYNSFSTTPIPTTGAPTEILANRFQAWRQLLKTLIAYFREIQASYETRAKATHKVQSLQNAISNSTYNGLFMKEHGLGEATKMLDDYHKRTIAEATKSRDIEEDVIGALTGLRNDLGQKIKEIKGLSGDFKNSVDKEKDNTKREVERYQQSIEQAEREGGAMGKNDPYVVKLGVDRAVERQLDEENYLHRAYLNLESSGRELESIVVGEIQKAYNALAGILKREGDDAHNTVDQLRTGPISLPKDSEWLSFVEKDKHFVDPKVPIRRVQDIDYPGKHHPSAIEVRSGMLERKSKYLKSYTPGWYVLSPTHLHEFKSAEKIYSQPPVMSLYLPDQKLGSHSQSGSSSHKFMVKGKQSGGVHKGHNWVFRAESYDTMSAWFEDMRILTEKSGAEKEAFVRKHARSYSSASRRPSVSSDGMEEDEADDVPYSADASSLAPATPDEPKQLRPQPGGRFPSDLQIPRTRGASEGEYSNASSDAENAAVLAGGAGGLMPGSNEPTHARYANDPYRLEGVTAGTATVNTYNWEDRDRERNSYFGGEAATVPDMQRSEAIAAQHQQEFLDNQRVYQPVVQLTNDPSRAEPTENSSVYGEWMAPAIAVTGVAGAGAGTAAMMDAQPAQRQVPVAAPAPVIPEKSTRRSMEIPDTFIPTGPTSELGGLEKEGAHETGTAPTVVRHDTEMSVSQLHLPGEFPQTPGV